MKQVRWSALPVASLLLLLSAPFAQRAIPTDVVQVEDPEPLPDISKGRTAPTAPLTAQEPASPATQQPPVAPDVRVVRPPAKGVTGGSK